jgi:hypothetical protein
MSYFSSTFNLTEEETVALMGAHNLGLATLENSGFSGQWVNGQAGRLNNQFYKILINSNQWTQM